MGTKKKATKASKAKQKLDDLPAEEDARAALDRALLLRAAQPRLKALAADLLARAKGSAAVTAALKARHGQERGAERTADPYEVWLRAFVEQVAAAWLLSCVFVRVLEDRGLVEQNRIAGPGALDSQQLFFELAPSLSERDYLLMVFRELSQLPAARDLFDARHNPVWLLAPSAEGARELLALFRTPSPHAPALRFGQDDTRFLGDLYQDLSEDVRQRYALLQTPDFIERFILDRTLERAIERFGLGETTLIDPTCGSGHFLLGAFDRLFEHRLRSEPGLDKRQAALKALDAISGADINPYAIAIARFRLTLAYLEKAGHSKLAQAPQLPLHLVVADSLLHNPQGKVEHEKHKQSQMGLGEVVGVSRAEIEGELYALEDEAAAKDVLYRRYAAVVGNPPYIVPNDSKRSALYKQIYKTAVGAYHLSAPFTERFFQLAMQRGCVGAITDNGFMKREYGETLIAEFLPTVNIDLIINTSGAYIPGHGTPTVLLFGTAEPEVGDMVPAVLPKRGEPSTPDEAADGLVWSSIAKHWNEIGFENEYISVENVERPWLHTHPWVLSGGGAIDLFKRLNAAATSRLGGIVSAIGRTTHTGEDSFFFVTNGFATRLGLAADAVVPLVKGEQVRDWAIGEDEYSIFPYSVDGSPRPPREGAEVHLFWRYRRLLRNRKDYGEYIEERKQGGRRLAWFEHSMFFPERFVQPLGIAFAFVATHNHFVLDRGGKVFNRSAPIIKLPETATEDDHLALLAYLNSSTACFWMKQVMHDKGSGTDKGKWQDDPAKIAYEFAGTPLFELPIPSFDRDVRDRLRDLAVELLQLAESRHALARRVASEAASFDRLAMQFACCAEEDDRLLKRQIALQERVDWLVYSLFGLVPSAVPFVEGADALALGARAFERRQARHGVSHGTDGQALVADVIDGPESERARDEALERSTALRLIESSEYKRRWAITPKDMAGRVLSFGDRVESALVDALAGEIERVVERQAQGRVVEQRAIDTAIAEDPRIATRFASIDGLSLPDVESILARAEVPFLSALRFSASGRDKFDAWCSTWEAQRREDLGETGAAISVPPRYARGDYRDESYWELRGKLDVPKERFISYPGCESDEDGEPLYGWAGWNHLQQAQALAGLYEQRKSEGWQADRLTPMLAGLLELLPWIKQWHNEPSAEYDGMRLGDYFQGYLDGECATHGLSHDDLRAWRPTGKKPTARGRR